MKFQLEYQRNNCNQNSVNQVSPKYNNIIANVAVKKTENDEEQTPDSKNNNKGHSFPKSTIYEYNSTKNTSFIGNPGNNMPSVGTRRFLALKIHQTLSQETFSKTNYQLVLITNSTKIDLQA